MWLSSDGTTAIRNRWLALVVLAFGALGSAVPAQACSLCTREIVLTPATAACLERGLAASSSEVGDFVFIDLTPCLDGLERTRGVVPALPGAATAEVRLTPRVVIERVWLACLVERFAARRASLDPYAVIDLGDCPTR